MVRVKSFKSLLKDFAEWTSITGPIQIVYALNSVTRFLWVVIWLGLFGVFVYQFYLIVNKYSSYPAEFHDFLSFTEKRFPVVTICNQNPYKLDVINSNKEFSKIRLLMADFQRMSSAGYKNISDDHFGLNNALTSFKKETWARKSLHLLTKQIPKETIRKAVYSFEEFVKSCHFNYVPCDRTDFTSYLDPTYGACYQFNAYNRSEYRTYRAGSNFGLRVLLLTKQVHPVTGAQIYLPTTFSSGVRMNAQYDNEDPAMESFGLNFGVGREWMVSMENTKTSLLKEPYDSCVDSMNGSLNYYQNFKYDIQNCLRSCKQNHIIDECGCADPQYNKPDNVSYCQIENVNCLVGIEAGHLSSQKFTPIRNCSCYPACEKQSIELIVTSGTFPAENFAVPYQKNLQNDMSFACQGQGSQFHGDIQRCIQWYRQNALVLNIWYDGLDYINHDERASYTLVKASNDLGGQMGLWLGVSVISIFELVALIFMIFLYFIQVPAVRVEPTPEEFNKDFRFKQVQDLKKELDQHEALDEKVRAKIRDQQHQREQKRVQAQQKLKRAEQFVQQSVENANSAAVKAAQNLEDTKAQADAANAKAIATGLQIRLQKLREIISSI